MNRSRRCFTLLEVVVVTALMGLAATAVALRWAGAVSSLDRRRAAEALMSFDALGRSAAMSRTARLRIEFEANGRAVVREPLSGAELSEFRTPRGWKITGVRTHQGWTRSGLAVIEIAESGYTCMYAVEIGGQSRPLYLAFAGLTGLTQELASEQDIDQLFTITQARLHFPFDSRDVAAGSHVRRRCPNGSFDSRSDNSIEAPAGASNNRQARQGRRAPSNSDCPAIRECNTTSSRSGSRCRAERIGTKDADPRDQSGCHDSKSEGAMG